MKSIISIGEWIAYKKKRRNISARPNSILIYCLGKASLKSIEQESEVVYSEWLYSDPKLGEAQIGDKSVSIVRGRVGGPATGKIVEELIHEGVRKIFIIGRICGFENTRIGDIILSRSVLTQDGTSRIYSQSEEVESSLPLLKATEKCFRRHNLPCRIAKTVSVDAPYCVQPEQIAAFSERGAVGMEMETAAVYAIAQHRRAEAVAALVVSDTISSHEWHPGFADRRVELALENAAAMITEVIQGIYP